MAKYDSWSLREIKAAMRDAHTKMHQMSTLYETYADAANSLDELVGRLSVARTGVQSGWQGPASDASAAAMDGVVRQSDGSRDASAHLARLNRKLARSTAHHHDMVDGVPDVDTSFAAAMESSYMNPFMALPEHDARVYHATKNQQLAASHARALDHVSGEWEHDMKATDWPATTHDRAPLPPRTLPARQHQPPTQQPRTPVVDPPPRTGTDPEPTPHHPVHKPPSGDRAHGTGDGVDPTSVLTAGAHGGGLGGATGTGTGGPGDLGVTGGGTGGGLGGGGGVIGGLGGVGGGGGGGAGGRGGAGGVGDERGVGSRVGVGEPGAAERGAARGLGAAAAGERGPGMMGAPMGGGRRGGGGDEEHRRPDYLEDDDVWGADVEGVPPVLGEDY